MTAERPFEFGGINHLALVCSDMQRTVDFYSGVLGLPLIKTIELPAGMGQHFFFDIGNGDSLAFFWFPKAPEAAPGIASPKGRPDVAELETAIASMNHVAFDVPADKIETYRDKLVAAGIPCSEVANHDNSEWGISRDMNDDVFVRSVYFQDPDGILLELACWTKAFTTDDVRHAPARSLTHADL
jgi:catechol 2,3-dioxygenase-like lactoylglutathione lyase family enzyme